MDKRNIHFPGYGRCIACQTLVSEKEFHNHTLNCRSTKSNDNKICLFCNQTFDNKLFKQHMETCEQQINIHSQINQENDEGYQTPRAQTPTQIERDSTKQNNTNNQISTRSEQNINQADLDNHLQSSDHFRSHQKERKVCGLCKQQIEIPQYRQHVASCSNNQTSTYINTNTTKYINNEQNNSSLQVSQDNQTKLCGLCQQLVRQTDFDDHIHSCSNKQMNKKQIKHCGLCKQEIESSDYRNHVASCSIDRLSSTEKRDNSTSSLNEVHKERKRKLCGLCKKEIDLSEYRNHVASCSTHRSSSTGKTSQSLNEVPQVKKTKVCPSCKERIDQVEFVNHLHSCSNKQINKEEINSSEYRTDVASCSTNRSSSENEKALSSKGSLMAKKCKLLCRICDQSFSECQYREHVQSCLNNDKQQLNSVQIDQRSSREKNLPKRKSCGLCQKEIEASEYPNHVASCSKSIIETEEEKNCPSVSSLSKKRECSPSCELIDDGEYVNCSSNGKRKSERDLNNLVKDEVRNDGGSDRKPKKRDCFVCFKPVDLSQFEDHVRACVAALDERSANSSSNKKFNCFSCNCPLKREENNSWEILCHSHHHHCLSCLTKSMEDFARNRQTPVCHQTLCDYQLSRHDISLIPLARHISDRLLKVAKGEQRPYCSKCHFYVHLNENEHFDEHFQRCGDPIPCEYCLLPYSIEQLEDHMTQCLNDQTSQNEKLILFLLSRTKYPFSKEQIRIYIQHHPNQSDPNFIVDELAIFGATFPYDIPMRECGICVESRPYDDIYVFDCDESHKICYDCYYYSCQTKINAGEILTCALCTHHLRDGELNQLRIPYEQLQVLRDYQMKKTFEVYSSRTRGIIKCPNQNCTWVAEAEDPNERFRVHCPRCKREFCSLCNQQYHYRTKCQQLPQITQRWFFWCETERARYLNIRAQQDNQYAQQLQEYNKRNKDNENRNKDLRRRYEELMNDEQYKAQNCRLCPSCKRVVQRLEGCDTMICGQDAHGGNLQSGCGAKFNWSQAHPYTTATTEQQPRQVMLDLPKPENPVVHHNGVKCDFCQEDLSGIRFDCVHCPALTFCEKCEQQATLNHSRENQDDGQQQHVFRLIMELHEELQLF